MTPNAPRHPQAGHATHVGHTHGSDADARRLTVALGLILGFMLVEVVSGILAHSLALLSDAAHMLTDAAAIGLSLMAVALAQRPAKGAMTYGLGRVEVLAAQANGVTLLVLAAFVVYEATRRLVTPPAVHAGLILAVALAGVAVNLVASWVLSGDHRRSINIEGSFQHILTDLYAFAGTAIAAGVILATGFQRADPLASLLVAALMLRSALILLKASGRVFLEAAPHGLDVAAIGNALVSEAGIVEVHDLHVWEVTSGFPALSAHVLVGSETDCHAARLHLSTLLGERFGIAHTTLQVEHEADELLEIAPAGARPAESSSRDADIVTPRGPGALR